MKMSAQLRVWVVVLLLVVWAFSACGPVPKPQNAYEQAPDLLKDMVALRQKVNAFRISGKVDHFGKEHRIQGKLYLFSKLPKQLRIDLLSPFGNTLSVLTVNDGQFALSDHREGRYMTGEAKPCNIARLIRIPLPPEDVMGILVGHTPILEGTSSVEWDTQGFYVVEIEAGKKSQTLHVAPDRETLWLLRSVLKDSDGIIFDISYEKWRAAGGSYVPLEIRVKMPRDKADLLLRYDEGGVETNVDMPDDAWDHRFPASAMIEYVTCD